MRLTALRIPPDLHKHAIKKAKADGRTFSSYLRQLIKKDVERNTKK
jgi:predicted HicB family RNase H-like nuclease